MYFIIYCAAIIIVQQLCILLYKVYLKNSAPRTRMQETNELPLDIS